MSYGITVWTAKPIDINQIIANKQGWKKTDIGYEYNGKGWLADISVSEKLNINDESVPNQVTFVFKNYLYSTELTIEPIQTPGNSMLIIKEILDEILSKYLSVVIGPDFFVFSKDAKETYNKRHKAHVIKRFKLAGLFFIPIFVMMISFTVLNTHGAQRVGAIFGFIFTFLIIYFSYKFFSKSY